MDIALDNSILLMCMVIMYLIVFVGVYDNNITTRQKLGLYKGAVITFKYIGFNKTIGTM